MYGVVEEAKDSNGEVIGWRIRTHCDTVLIWKDQEAMPGIRTGEGFVPSYGDSITYNLLVKLS